MDNALVEQPWGMSTLHIRLLGDFHLIDGEAPVAGVNSARLQSLLAYLLLHRDAPQRRQHLAFLFWPDTSEQQALTNLRTLLHRLRQALPMAECFLHADSQTVQWQPDADYTLDVADFEAALAQAKSAGDLEQALQLYGGGLLPSCYDDWIPPLREQLRQRAMRALARLMEMLEAERRYSEAIGYGQRLLQLDPLDEATYRKLIHLHTVAGDRPGALRVYQLCESTLRQELATEPAQATRELYQRLRSATIEPSSQARDNQAGPTLVGRKAEWKLLQDAWHAASAGRSHCVVVTGESGIGKTRLANELLNWVNRQGFITAAAHCYGVEGDLSYAPLVTWLCSERILPQWATLAEVWLAELARLLPELQAQRPGLPRPGPLTEGWQRQRLFAALAQALLKAGAASLFFIDDLQWCDADTLAWLHYALHANTQASLLLVGTMRTEEMGGPPLADWLAALQRGGKVTELTLGPLNVDETANLAAQIAGRLLTAEESTHLYRETEGNPLFVVESVRAEFAGGEESATGGDVPTSLGDHPLPAKVQTVIQTRLARLSPAARDLAGVAAAIGRSFPFEVLAKASRLDEERLVHCLNELEQQRIVQERGGYAYDFTHDKLREVTYNRLSVAQRRLLHRRIAEALESVHGQALEEVSAQVAGHYERAGLVDQAIPYYQRAAEVAERLYANAEAIAHYQRGLALLATTTKQTEVVATVLYERLADVLQLTAQIDEARQNYQRAQASALPADLLGRARLQRKIGKTFLAQSNFSAVEQNYQLAQDFLGEPPPFSVLEWWQEWFQLQCERMLLYYWQSQPDQIELLAEQTRPFVEQHGTDAQRARFFYSLLLMEINRQRYRTTETVLETMHAYLTAQQKVDNPGELAFTIFVEGFCWLWYGDLAKAEQRIQQALGMAEPIGDLATQTRCLNYLTVIHRKRGDVRQVEHFARCTLQIATTATMPEYLGQAKANIAWVAWRQGELTQAKRTAEDALSTWRSLPGLASTRLQWTALLPLLALAVQRHDLPEIVAHAQALLDPIQIDLPDALIRELESALRTLQQGDMEMGRTLFQGVIDLAERLHYL